jgi:hypothetical protein
MSAIYAYHIEQATFLQTNTMIDDHQFFAPEADDIVII